MKNNNMNFILFLSTTSNILTLLVTNSEYLSKFALSHIIMQNILRYPDSFCSIN